MASMPQPGRTHNAADDPSALQLSQQCEYLRSLLELATKSVLTRPNASDTVTREMLMQQFHQPFDSIAEGAIPVVDRPIHPARLAIEVLRSYLRTLNMPTE